MKEVKCRDCGNGTGLFRHDKHLIHGLLLCGVCQELKNKEINELKIK